MANPDVSAAAAGLLAARRRLAAELRRLRLNTGQSTHELAAAMRAAGHQISQSAVSKIETGQRSASIPTVRAWAQATSLTGEQAEALVRLAERALTDMLSRRAIISGEGGVAAHQRRIGDLERAAGLICEFEPVWIPGLLQTAEYVRQATTSVHPEGPDPDRLGAILAARLDRQAVLADQTKRFEYVTTEGALRHRLGSIQMQLAQLDRLATTSTLPNVNFGIIPQATSIGVWYATGFVIFDKFADGSDPIVFVETLTGEPQISDPDDVALYRSVFERLRNVAVTGDDARHLLAAIMDDLRRLLVDD
jgi:transcriptional regulator with XRE-family HTH domain